MKALGSRVGEMQQAIDGHAAALEELAEDQSSTESRLATSDAALEEIEGPRAALAPLEQLLRSVWKSTSAEAVTRTTSRRWRGAPEI